MTHKRYGASARAIKSNSLMMLRQTVPSSSGALVFEDAQGGASNVMHEKRTPGCSPEYIRCSREATAPPVEWPVKTTWCVSRQL